MAILPRSLLVSAALLVSVTTGHAASLHGDGIDVFTHAGGMLSPDSSSRGMATTPLAGPVFPDSRDQAGSGGEQGVRAIKPSPDGIDLFGAGRLNTQDTWSEDPFASKPAGVADSSAPRRDDRRDGQTGSSIPLPPAFPLLAAAILALAGFGYGLNRWVAPRGRSKAS